MTQRRHCIPIMVLAVACLLPSFAAPSPPFQEDAPDIFGKATAIDVDLLRVKGHIVVLRGVKVVTYKRKPKELNPVANLQARLDRGPVRCEGLEKYNIPGKEWFVGTCYLVVGERTEIDLNQWIVASGFAASFGDDYLEDEKFAQESELGMWKRRVRLRSSGLPWAEPSGAARRRTMGEMVGE